MPPYGTNADSRDPIRLAIVIVNFRTPELVLASLSSLEGEVDPTCDCVLVVDNGSEDGSAEQIRTAIRDNGWGTWARLTSSPVNGGYSYGNNLGIRSVNASAYLLLNSDAFVLPGAIGELLTVAAENPRAALIGPRIEREDGTVWTSAFRYPSPVSEFLDAAATGPLTRLLARYDVPLRPATTVQRPDWVSFACVLLRREAFDEVGPLDEGYFMYFEDVDYCRRVRRSGWRILCSPAARVVHLHSRTSRVEFARQERRRRPRYYYDSRSRYFAKFYGRAGLWLANSLWLAGRSVSFLREVLGAKKPHTYELEWRDIWRGAFRPLRPYSGVSRPPLKVTEEAS
jgi:GT2 family glycosyltransferase